MITGYLGRELFQKFQIDLIAQAKALPAVFDLLPCLLRPADLALLIPINMPSGIIGIQLFDQNTVFLIRVQPILKSDMRFLQDREPHRLSETSLCTPSIRSAFLPQCSC